MSLPAPYLPYLAYLAYPMRFFAEKTDTPFGKD